MIKMENLNFEPIELSEIDQPINDMIVREMGYNLPNLVARVRFENGYDVEVRQGNIFTTNNKDEYELAIGVIGRNQKPEPVGGFLKEKQVDNILRAIQLLPTPTNKAIKIPIKANRTTYELPA